MRDADLTRISVVVDLWVDTEDYADIIVTGKQIGRAHV